MRPSFSFDVLHWMLHLQTATSEAEAVSQAITMTSDALALLMLRQTQLAHLLALRQAAL